ncbi:hypothetical protein Ct9H90mP12_2450 [bacterium]|nr:MAG: hypothetical protein Ct9H90mP12_2450 [bacterium]
MTLLIISNIFTLWYTSWSTAFYQSGYPYTPIIFKGKDPAEDLRHPNSKRGPAYRNVNLSFSKYFGKHLNINSH